MTDSGLRHLCAAVLAQAGKDARSKNAPVRQEAIAWLSYEGKLMAALLNFVVDIEGWLAELNLPIDKG